MNRINEIGDTPRGQYMLGRLSQSYGEPNLYSDDYDEVPEIADYASRNWKKDGNARAFDLGKGDEANTKWVDDGNQSNFRKMHKLPQFENKQINRTYMNKRLIRLTESDLHRIVKESAQKILKEIGDTPKGQRALGAVAARSIHRMHNALNDDQPEEAAYWDNVANDAARISHNNVNPDWDKETEYFDDGVDYWHDNLRQYESKNVKKDLIRLTESDLYRIVKESKEGYNYIMSVRNNPIFQQELKKAWNKEIKTNPNPDWDTFEYNFALRCLDKEREEDAKHYYKMRKIQRQLDNNTRKNV